MEIARAPPLATLDRRQSFPNAEPSCYVFNVDRKRIFQCLSRKSVPRELERASTRKKNRRPGREERATKTFNDLFQAFAAKNAASLS